MSEVTQPRVTTPTVVLPVWLALAFVGALMVSVAPSLLILAANTHLDDRAHDLALFAHLASLVLGFGAVLSVDWVGLLWVLRRRELTDVLTAAANVHIPVWIGYAGLVASGLLLEPHLGALHTQVKLGSVLLIGLNGLVATWLHVRLGGAHGRGVLIASSVCAAVSQVGWWTAMTIGFLNAH